MRVLRRTATALSGSICLLVPAAVGVPQAGAEAGCTVNHSERQICGAGAVKTSVGSTAALTLAQYEDLSRCSFPAPASELGNNGNYVVAKVIVEWGDGTPAGTGTATTGATCAGSDEGDETGETEPVTASHSYAKPGTYSVSVSIVYQRGAGNTGTHCATATGATSYDVLTNCIALGAPVTTTVTVAPKRVKVPNLKGKTLKQVKTLLARAHLKLGHVTHRGGHVSRQTPRAGTSAASGAAVSVILH